MEKNVTIKNIIDFKAMKYFNMYNLRYKKKFIWVYIVLIVICIGSGVATLIAQNYLLAVLFGIFAIYLVYQTLNMEKMIDRQITAYFQRSRPIEQVLEIDEEKIDISSPYNPEKVITYEWIHITQIHEIPEYFFLFAGKQPLIIAKDPNLVLEGSYDDLLEIINEKIESKPYKKVDKQIVKNEITFVHPNYDEMEAAQHVELESEETVEAEVDPDFDEAEEIEVEIDTDENVEEAGKPQANDKDWV